MLAYAANRSPVGRRDSSPNALLLIIAAHVALIAAVMSAKLELPPRFTPLPPLIRIPLDPLPPPENHVARKQPSEGRTINRPTDRGAAIASSRPSQPSGGGGGDSGTAGAGGANVLPEIPQPVVTPTHQDPRLLTPPSELKPPYPPSKILSEEEAVLTLRLSIDEHGRVAAVEPVGRTDRDFLDAARRYLMAHWRYQPAMDDGRAVASSMVITLRFELSG